MFILRLQCKKCYISYNAAVQGMEFKVSNGEAQQVCVCSKSSMCGNCVIEWNMYLCKNNYLDVYSQCFRAHVKENILNIS